MKHNQLRYLMAMLCFGTAGSMAQGAHRYVSSSGSHTSPYASWATAATNIQTALNASGDEDTVWVTNGVWRLTEQLRITNRITVRSVNGPSTTALHGQNATRCVWMESAGSWLIGFTVTGGNSDGQDGGGGGGVYSVGGSLYDCVVSSNRAADIGYGGGVCASGSARIQYSTIQSNYGGYGGLFLMYGSSAQGCVIRDNTAKDWAGGAFVQDSALINCLVTGNRAITPSHSLGGGVFADADSRVEFCTIAGNSAAYRGGGLYARYGARIQGTIVVSNMAPDGEDVFVDDSYEGAPPCSFTNCCIPTVVNGVGNITDSPQFTDWVSGDLSLAEESPCIDAAGSMSGIEMDLLGHPRAMVCDADLSPACDMGAMEFQEPGGWTPPEPIANFRVISNGCIQGQNAGPSPFEFWNSNEVGIVRYTIRSTVDWISVEPAEAAVTNTSRQTHEVRYQTDHLPAGEYAGTIVIELQGIGQGMYLGIGSALTVTPSEEAIGVSAGMRTQTVAAGSASFQAGLGIWNAGTGTMAYTVASSEFWLDVAPGDGSSDGAYQAHTLTYHPAGLSEGAHQATLTITADGAANSPMSLPFELVVTPRVGSVGAQAVAPPESPDASGNIELWNDGSGNEIAFTLQSDADWLVLGDDQGTLGVATSVIPWTADLADMDVGVHETLVHVVTENGRIEDVPVRVTIGDGVGEFAEKIVYASNAGGDWDIWIADTNGANRRVLFHKDGDQTRPRVSPDGTKLAYLDGYLTIRNLRDGSEMLVQGLDGGFEWLSNSELVGHVAWGCDRIYLVNLATGSRSTLFQEDGRQTIAAADPLRRKIYYFSDPCWWAASELKVFDMATSNRTTLLANDNRQEYGGTVSPNGRRIAYAKSMNADQTPFRIFGIETATPGVERWLSGSMAQSTDRSPWFTPDNNHLLFSRKFEGIDSGIYKTDFETGTSAYIFQDEDDHDYPSWATLYVALTNPPAPAFDNIDPAQGISIVAHTGQDSTSIVFQIRNAAPGAMVFAISNDVDWVLTRPQSGISTGQWIDITNTYPGATLANMGSALPNPTMFYGTMTIAYGSNLTRTLDLGMQLHPRPARMLVSPTPTQNVTVIQSQNADARNFAVRNIGGGMLAFTVSVNQAWMNLAYESCLGWSTGDIWNVRVDFQTASLPPGAYTGLVTFAGESLASGPAYDPTQKVAVVMNVIEDPTQPAVRLAHSPSVFNVNIDPNAQTTLALRVWNAGGQTLDYTASVNRAWIAITPLSGRSYGVNDEMTLLCTLDATTLIPNAYTSATLSVRSAQQGTTSNITVHVNVNAGMTLTTSIEPAGWGWLHNLTTPNAPNNKYLPGTEVVLRGYANQGYAFDQWIVNGLEAGGMDLSKVRMDSSKTVVARFRALNGFGGTVTNRVTGRPIWNARVAYGPEADTRWLVDERGGLQRQDNRWTDASGRYSFPGVPAGRRDTLSFSSIGYVPELIRSYSPPATGWGTTNIGMTPSNVRNLRVVQIPGSRRVEITYDLVGDTNVPLDVTVEVDARVHVYTNNALHLYGHFGRGIVPVQNETPSPGEGKRVYWNPVDDWPAGYYQNLAIRVKANGCVSEYEPFTVDTLAPEGWMVRAWCDRNRNNSYDSGEELAGAEVYFNGRTYSAYRGVTDSRGNLTICELPNEGTAIFARKMIFEKNSYRAHHQAVGNKMLSVWLDSDVGATSDNDFWDGEWRTYRLTAEDMTRIRSGQPLMLRLRHPIFEFHLLANVEQYIDKSTPAGRRWMRAVHDTYVEASRRLYDATDGQVKLGMVAIDQSEYEDDIWDESDVVMTYDTMHPNASVLGIWGGNSVVKDYNIEFGFFFEENTNALPDAEWVNWASLRWGSIMAHECGHYILGFDDEYLNGWGEEAQWNSYRAANPNLVPENFGLMDHDRASIYEQRTPGQITYHIANSIATELSSYNDYLSMSSYSSTYTRPSQQSRQLDQRSLPCWQYLQRALPNSLGIIFTTYGVSMIAPQPGQFVSLSATNVGWSSSPDRPGPTRIPEPYDTLVYYVTGDPIEMSETRRSAAPRVQVVREGAPAAGAVLAATMRDGRKLFLGRLARGGIRSLDLDGIATLDAYHQGDKVTYDLSSAAARRAALDGTIIMDLADADNHRRGTPVSPDDLGSTLFGSVDANGDFHFGLRVNKTLEAVPTAQIWHHAQPTITNYIDIHATGEANLYTGTVSLTDSYDGVIEITCVSDGGLTNHGVHLYKMQPIPTNETIELWSKSGLAQLMGWEVTGESQYGLVIESESTPYMQEGETYTNLLGPVLVASFSSTNAVMLNFSFHAEDAVGLDRAAIMLHKWNDTLWSWEPLPSAILSLRGSVVSLEISGSGAYAIFGRSLNDIAPPGSITNLVALPGDQPGFVRLTWTAPGGDDDQGKAAEYILRGVSGADEYGWNDLSDLSANGLPEPDFVGMPQSAHLDLGQRGATFTLGMMAVDEAGYVSATGNITVVTTPILDLNNNLLDDQWEASVSESGFVDAGGDDDNDGLDNWTERQRNTDPNAWDTDGDGYPDGWEVQYGYDPLVAQTNDLADADGDTLTDKQELALGSDPGNQDTDGDGMRDDWEIAKNLDPLNAYGDFGPDVDIDGDTFNNYSEYVADTHPTNAASFLHIKNARAQADFYRLTFLASSSRLYQVQTSTNLFDPIVWEMAVPPGSFMGCGTEEHVDLAIPTNQSTYIRLEVTAPK